MGKRCLQVGDLFATDNAKVVHIRSIWIRHGEDEESVRLNGDSISGFEFDENRRVLISLLWDRGVSSYLQQHRGDIVSETLANFLISFRVRVFALPSHNRIYLMNLGGVVPIEWN